MTPIDESEQYEKICQPQLNRIEGCVQKIFRVLEGDGNIGLVEKVARHDERIKTLQGWRKWAIGFGSTLVIALIVYILTR